MMTTEDVKDLLRQMTELRDGIREEQESLLPSMTEVEAQYSLCQRQIEYLNSSIMNIETYLTLEKGDADAN